MATEEKKKEHMMEVIGITIYGLVHGMWELFGDSSFATSGTIGDMILERAQNESGLEIQGENAQDIMTELVRLAVDELGLYQDGKATIEGDRVIIKGEKCQACPVCNNIQKSGAQPFFCAMLCMSSAAMRQGLGKKNRFVSRKYDEGTKTCTLEIQLMQ
jgi:ferredoxin